MHVLDSEFGLHLSVPQWLEEDSKLNEDAIRERCLEKLQAAYDGKEQSIGSETMRMLEKSVMLRQLDVQWKEHLGAMDYLRQGIHLRGYAQKNPKQEYKREAFEMFGAMLDRVKQDTISILSRVRVQSEEDVRRMDAQRRAAQDMKFQHADSSALGQGQPAAAPGSAAAQAPQQPQPQTPFVRDARKVGRNEPCPCGSGKKYKQCHGRLN
jgi:preprotein translocase subunit SecA